jgi:hypothetical protein
LASSAATIAFFQEPNIRMTVLAVAVAQLHQPRVLNTRPRPLISAY